MAQKTLSQKFLKEALHYNPETGIFTWKVRPHTHFKSVNSQNVWNSRYANKIAGSLCLNGYIKIYLLDRCFLAHRLAWFYVHGYMPNIKTHVVDHFNLNKTDNRLINLREKDHAYNSRNIRKPKHNTTGYMGVSIVKKGKKRFRACIQVDRKTISIGTYYTAEEASRAYNEKKKELHGIDITVEEYSEINLTPQKENVKILTLEDFMEKDEANMLTLEAFLEPEKA